MSRKTRKLIWSAPLVAVFAVIGALALFVTQTPGGIFADELADAPQNLKVKAADGSAGRTTLVLTWEAPESGAPDMYRIDRSSDNSKWKYLESVSGDSVTYTDSTVKGKFQTGTTQYYRVFAKDSEHGSGAVSTSESATTTPISVPGQVKPFAAAADGPEANMLTWTAPDDGGSDLLGYCIRAWPTNTTAGANTIAPLTETNCRQAFFADGPDKNVAAYADNGIGGIITILPAASYKHTGLRAKQNWSYEIYGLNEHGHSETPSAVREATTSAANDPPKPGNLLVLESGTAGAGGQVDLYWTVTGDGGQNITAYRVEVSDTSNQWPAEDSAVNATAVARSDDEDLALRPGSPTGATAPNVAAISVPALSDGDTATSYDFRHTGQAAGKLYYRVRVETGTGGNMKASAYTMGSVDVKATELAYNNLRPDAPVLGADGISGGSPTDHIGTEDSATDDDVTPGEVTLTVQRSENGGTDDYRVDISDDDGRTWTMVHSSTRPINQTEYEHQGLKPNQERHFRIFTKNGSAYGLASDIASDYSAHSKEPGKVRALTAMPNGAGAINLSWSAPSNDGGAMIDKYCIIAVKVNDAKTPISGTDITRTGIRVVDGDSNPQTENDNPNCARFSLPKSASFKLTSDGVYDVAASTTSVMLTGLEQKTRWKFEVYGLNGATVGGDPDAAVKGVAKESETEDAKTTEAVVPSAPVNLTAELARDTNFSGIGSRGVLVLWNAPSDPAGAPLSGYKIERKVDDGEYEEKVSSRSAGMTHWVDTSEPAEGEVRVYRVTSINAVGTGTEMAMVAIPLAAHITHPPGSTALTAPTGVMATDAGNPVTVTWTPGENADGGHLVLVFNSDFTAVPGIAVPTADGTYTFDDVDFDAGGYVAVVVSVKTRTEYLYDYDTFTVQ